MLIGQSAWYGRSRHRALYARAYELFTPQSRPLCHAETVLFVYHRQSKVFKHHRLLYQRMGAYEYLDFSLTKVLRVFTCAQFLWSNRSTVQPLRPYRIAYWEILSSGLCSQTSGAGPSYTPDNRYQAQLTSTSTPGDHKPLPEPTSPCTRRFI